MWTLLNRWINQSVDLYGWVLTTRKKSGYELLFTPYSKIGLNKCLLHAYLDIIHLGHWSLRFTGLGVDQCYFFNVASHAMNQSLRQSSAADEFITKPPFYIFSVFFSLLYFQFDNLLLLLVIFFCFPNGCNCIRTNKAIGFSSFVRQISSWNNSTLNINGILSFSLIIIIWHFSFIAWTRHICNWNIKKKKYEYVHYPAKTGHNSRI